MTTPLTPLIQRCRDAEETLFVLALDADTDRASHLLSKREGVALARGYLEEAERLLVDVGDRR